MGSFDPMKIVDGVKEFQKAVDNILDNHEVQKTTRRTSTNSSAGPYTSTEKPADTVEDIPGFIYENATELDVIMAALDIYRDAYISSDKLAHKIHEELLRFRRFQAITAAKGL
jgi:hypothetical protein